MIDELCKVIVSEARINRFVETGTLDGESMALVSVWFAELYDDFGVIDHFSVGDRKSPNPWNSSIPYPVFRQAKQNSKGQIFSIDIDDENVQHARNAFKDNPNIHILQAHSPDGIRHLIDEERLTSADNVLFYLDAHCEACFPLREEIMQVLRLQKFMIVIDDCFIPGHFRFGYDVYCAGICGYSFVKDLFLNRSVRVFYPVRSNRDNRGWVLISSGFEPAIVERICLKIPIYEGSFPGRTGSFCRSLFRYWFFRIAILRKNTARIYQAWERMRVHRSQKQ